MEAPKALEFGNLDTIVRKIERLAVTMPRAEESHNCEESNSKARTSLGKHDGSSFHAKHMHAITNVTETPLDFE